ncbi:MAG: hypothetical protein WDW36_002466 [Sanguina aurantia]
MPGSCVSGGHAPAMARWQAHNQKLPRSPLSHSESIRRDLITLDTWKHSGGCLSVLEASMRDAHCPNDADAFIIAAEVAVRMVNRPRHAHDPASLPPMLSLAATVRKLVGLHTGYPIARPTTPGAVTGRLAPEVNLQLLAILMDSICHSMRAIDFAMLTEGTAAQAPRAPKTVPTGAPVTAECARQMRRVVATLLLCVLQCCGWRLRFEGGEDAAGRPLEWFADMKGQLARLSGEAGQLAREVMTSPRRAAAAAAAPAGRDTDLATMYERLAASSPQGVPLPGCCHLGCASFAGPGEGVLPTQLCGGCRRASYCSVACQKAAWKKGGHRAVCGKQ